MDIFLSHEHILKPCHPKMGDTELQNLFISREIPAEQTPNPPSDRISHRKAVARLEQSSLRIG